jgi:hypothetical protein
MKVDPGPSCHHRGYFWLKTLWMPDVGSQIPNALTQNMGMKKCEG